MTKISKHILSGVLAHIILITGLVVLIDYETTKNEEIKKPVVKFNIN